MCHEQKRDLMRYMLAQHLRCTQVWKHCHDFLVSALVRMAFPDSMLWMGVRAFLAEDDAPLPDMMLNVPAPQCTFILYCETACVRFHFVL